MENSFDLFSNSGFMPHGHCFLWNPSLLGLNVTSDLLIGVAYFAISITLYFLVKKINLPFSATVISFGVFIAACGLTHFMDVLTIWVPAYWVAGGLKFITAAASVSTAVLLIRNLPSMLKMARAESNLKRTEEHLSGIINTVRDYAIFMTTLDGTISSWNEGAKKIKGYSSEEIIGQNISRFYVPEDVATKKYEWSLEQAKKLGRFEDEGWRLKKDGTRFWANAVITPTYDMNQNHVGYLKITRDLTEKKLDEDRRRDLHAHLEHMVIERTAELTKTISELSTSQEQLKSLAVRLQTIQEDERLRISHDIHDVLGQSLTVLKMELYSAKEKIGNTNEAITGQLNAAIQCADDLLKTVRKIASDLRPTSLEHLGLAATIEWWLKDFQSRTGLNCQFSHNVQPKGLSKDVAIALFRVLQESLTNVVRHSGSNKVETKLNNLNGKIELTVHDFGKGFDSSRVDSARGSLGLVGMRERIQNLGGEFSITSQPNHGTFVTATVPMRERD